ncbi:TIR domain-containing protein [Chondrus crispus]|uniref:ADP-ribosyl cyclase/cyclic ADP-ribose hydrolase n=1 Tax=Chondrus crispus TaxID=2769 RepID=R7QNL7_CHOCR|nr:TIR domain-containing protein [Chondrus crispus]CDF40092.1 TIR domain-containing protein [Chondrus crispus]|eukprot:XP_005710386.1 TIR domain-containing protein [Chondrus crispus]
MFAPAMTCLTKLLKFEHEGVPSDIRCEKLRRSVLNVKNGIESRPFVDHCDSYEYVEATLSEAKAQQSQIFLLVLGGGGRGKTSLVRSLKGMPFLSGYNPTQLAAVSWIQVHLGSRKIPRSQEELNDLACHQDSLTAILARLRQSNPPKLDQQMSFNSRTKTSEVVKQNSDPVIRSGTGDCTPSKKKRRRSDSPIDFASIKSEMTPQLSKVSIRPNSQLIDASHPPKRTHDYIASLMKDGPVCRRTSTQPQRPLIQCWDLAGQSQYVMAHALFVKNGNLIVFVVNLKRLRDEETRLDEVRELCRWMQLVFALVQDTASLRPIIVGTHKDSCGDWGDAVKVLHKGLLDEVGEAVYNTWVRAGLETENGGEGRAISLVAVENRTSQDDPEESGIQELEQLIKQRSADILASRQEVPLRWIAFVEETERRRPVVLNKNDISNFVDGFPGFSTKKKEREQDALQALRHFNSHGRNVLFELSEEEFYVFPCPDVMLDFVRRVTGPEALVRERLSQKNERMLAKGLVTFGGLRALWHEHPKETCNVMCDVLCSVDILMRVQPADGTPVHSEDLIAIPALLPKAGNWLHCASRPGESEVRLVTEFVDAFPPGLMSCLISHLYKKVGRATAKVGLVGSNAAVLTARVELKETGRVVVSFVSQKRHIEWKVFAQDPVSVARTCVTAVEEFSSMPLRGKRFRMKHFLRTKCRLDLNGCGGEWTASFQLPGDWVENDTKARLPNLDGECASPCEEAWRLWELMPEIVEDCRPEASGMMQQSSKVVRMEAMDVFISHAGTDKSFIAGPVFHEVQKEGLNCFLDKARIEPGDTGSDEMTAAMESAKIGVFILSPEFAARRWTMRELRCFLCRRREARRTGVMPPTILPVFYRLSICECRDFKPEQYVDEKGKSLFEREKFYSAERQNEATMAMVKAELREITEITGIENMEWASNNVHDLLAHDYRERLVKRIVMWVRKKWGEYWQQERAV